MRRLLRIFAAVWKPHRLALARGVALSIAVLVAGVALLGLSGWFITAAGMAGLAGLGLVFDVFRPSAAVRFLALGRAAARYGERLLTHDATLRGLAELRGRLLAAMTVLPLRKLGRLSGSERLNHLTIDVDALDGIALRLFIPYVSALFVLVLAFIALWRIEDIAVAAWQIGSFLVGIALSTLLAIKLAVRPSRLSQRAMQALRMRFIDMMRAQSELVVGGRLARQRQALIDAQDRLQAAQATIDRGERISGLVLGLSGTMAAGGSLYLGGMLALSGAIDPAIAAFGFFTALALAEAAGPLHRGMTELGKMIDAARRIEGQLDHETGAAHATAGKAASAPLGPVLQMENISFTLNSTTLIDGFSLSLMRGETVGLVGPSGSGKSTLLAIACGQVAPTSGRVLVNGHDIGGLPDTELFEMVGMLPQRSALLSGTILEALKMANPHLDEATAWRVLEAVTLAEVVRDKGGLPFRLGESGSGLSGGEQRRLALARVLLRKPSLLLLDEPTEGLDDAAARKVLDGIRAFLPDAAILLASHRQAEQAWAERNMVIKMREKRRNDTEL